jgi:integrase
MRLGTAYADLDLVFANEIGNPIHYRNLTQRHYEKILKSAGLDNGGFVLYSLRHTCATLLLAAGENPKVVSERLGHSTVRMTLDTYSHVLPDMQRSATEKLSKLVYG